MPVLRSSPAPARGLIIVPVRIQVVGAGPRCLRLLYLEHTLFRLTLIIFGFRERAVFESVDHVIEHRSGENMGVGSNVGRASAQDRLGQRADAFVIYSDTAGTGGNQSGNQPCNFVLSAAGYAHCTGVCIEINIKICVIDQFYHLILGVGQVSGHQSAGDRLDGYRSLALQLRIQHVLRLELLDNLSVLDTNVFRYLVELQ